MIEIAKIAMLDELISVYGETASLGNVKRKIQGEKNYKCPACNGTGNIIEEFNAYPKNLPDSGFVYKPGYIAKKCDLCDGFGYTAHEYKPKMVQKGWE